MDTLKNLTKTLSNVTDELSINYLDKSPGVKKGTLLSVQPSFKYVMKGGETAKPFTADDITLIQRRKINNEWQDVELDCFAINIKADKQNDNRLTYYTMLFRNMTSQDFVDEINESASSGTALVKAKPLYSIIINNKMTISNFFQELSKGKSITFAQYKRDNGQINFVDANYYNDKIAPKASEELPA